MALLNRARALAYMRDCGLDVLVVTSPVNITYFTDYYCWIDPLFRAYMAVPGASSERAQAYAILGSDGATGLMVNPLFAVNADGLPVDEVVAAGDAGLDRSLRVATPDDSRHFRALHTGPQRNWSPTDALLDMLARRGLSGARIGLEMEGLPAARAEEMRGALPGASIRDCTNLLRLIRMVKSAEELARLERAAAIAEDAGLETLREAHAGQSMLDLAQQLRVRLAAQGADVDHFAYGVRGYGIATDTDYRLTADDVLYVDWGCLAQRYFSDTGTTLAMGAVPDAVLGRRAKLQACIEAGRDALRPGVKASVVSAVLRETLDASGVDIRAANPHGHGMGLEIRDYPIIVPDNRLRIRDECVDVASDLPLEENMVINLEAGLFMPDVGSLQVEQSFVVTATACRPLVAQDRSAPLTPGRSGQ